MGLCPVHDPTNAMCSQAKCKCLCLLIRKIPLPAVMCGRYKLIFSKIISLNLCYDPDFAVLGRGALRSQHGTSLNAVDTAIYTSQ